MIRPPHFFEEAADEIEHERQWYRGRSHTAEDLFLREVDHAIEAIVEAPKRWPKYLAGRFSSSPWRLKASVPVTGAGVCASTVAQLWAVGRIETRTTARVSLSYLRTYTAVIEWSRATGLFVGFIPGFPGAHTQAESLDELNTNLREVLAMLLEDGEPQIEAEFVGTQLVRID